MGEAIQPTWATRDLPILRAALRRLDAGEDFPELEDIRAELGFSGDRLRSGLRALESAEPPYIAVGYASGWGEDRASGHVEAVSERARRELGAWPSADELVDRLVAALEKAAEESTSAEEKGRLHSAASTIAGMARDVAVGVISARIGQL